MALWIPDYYLGDDGFEDFNCLGTFYESIIFKFSIKRYRLESLLLKIIVIYSCCGVSVPDQIHADAEA